MNDSIDLLKYEYIPVALPNILYAWPRAATAPKPSPVKIGLVLDTLITELARRNPKWRFIFNHPSEYTDTKDGAIKYVINGTVYVFGGMDKKPPLGKIQLDRVYSTGGYRYALNSRRLDAARSRGYHTFTKDVKKAIRLCERNFVPRAPLEIFKEQEQKVLGALNNIRYSNARARSQLMEALSTSMERFIEENVEQLLQVPYMPKAVLAKVPHVTKEYRRLEDLWATAGANGAHVVLLDGETCYYNTERGGEMCTARMEELSEHVRVGIGMLKLVAPGTEIAGIGMKHGDNVFLIVPKEAV